MGHCVNCVVCGRNCLESDGFVARHDGEKSEGLCGGCRPKVADDIEVAKLLIDVDNLRKAGHTLTKALQDHARGCPHCDGGRKSGCPCLCHGEEKKESQATRWQKFPEEKPTVKGRYAVKMGDQFTNTFYWNTLIFDPDSPRLGIDEWRKSRVKRFILLPEEDPKE